MRNRFSLAAFLGLCFSCPAIGQDAREFRVGQVLQELQIPMAHPQELANVWWDAHVVQPIREESLPTYIDVHSLLSMALQSSAQIQVYAETPLIRSTSVREADAAFDWTRFADTMWNDSNLPVGNALTIGGAGDRFLDDQWTGQAGVRRKLTNGSQFQMAQQFGWQNTNSNFFIPNNQGTSRITMDFTVPMMRGRGTAYNTSLQLLTRTDVDTAQEEFRRQVQSHLMEIARGYWALYLERGVLAQKIRLYLRTKGIVEELEARRALDANPTQLISAQAALQNRLSDLIRAQAATKNAETRLRALINAVELGSADLVELIPLEIPGADFVAVDYIGETETALLHRPEVKAAILEIKAASVRTQMAQNELLPMLNLVTQAYVAGLRGNSDLGGAWTDQFTRGAPSYSIGLQYEVPFGNRAAIARRDRRLMELRQLQEQYRSTLETIRAEVEIAVREFETSYRELQAKAASLSAANAEVATIEARWRRMIDGDGTASLNLESLLRAQERVTEAEFGYLQSLLTYNLSFLNLKRANGTLLEWHGAAFGTSNENGVPRMQMDTFEPVRTEPVPGEFVPAIQANPSLYQPLESPSYSPDELHYRSK